MALAIVSADQRRAQGTVKGQIWGKAGVGKTTLLKTLDPATTLTLDFEAGLLAVERDDEFGPAWAGPSVKVENWPEAKAILQAFQAPERPAFLQPFKTVFVDSTTVASRMCFDWCKEQPEAFNKQGQKNNLGAYGLLGLEMVDWVKGWHHLPNLNVWLVGGMERKEIEGIKEWVPLLTGSKLASELPYIMDYSLVMAEFKAGDGKTYTGIFSDGRKNPEYASVPLKTRVRLDQVEQPHLGKLMVKALASPPKAQAAPPPSSVSAQPSGEASTTNTETSEAA
jgi:hypothetical protein